MPATFTVAAPPAAPTGRAIASLFKRALAILLDSCVVLILTALPLALIWVASGEPFDLESGIFALSTDDATTGELFAKVLQSLVLIAVWVLYRGLTTSRSGPWNGQTVGKRVCELRITNPDGQPITPRTAWKRTALEVLLLGSSGVVGSTIDLVSGEPPTGTFIATALGGLLFLIAIVPVLRGERRQTLYDRWASTIVIAEPKVLPKLAYAAPAPVGAPTPQPSVYAPLIEQPAAPAYGAAAPDPSPSQPIAPRPVRGQTWAAVILCAISAAGGIAMIPFLDDIQEWSERAERIRNEPENKAAIAKLRTLEKLGESCLKTGRSPDRCDDAGELGATDMEFADAFDLSTDPVGVHAGKVGAVVDGDDVNFYAFTSADRTWATIAGGGWLDRTCIQRDGDLCEDVADW